MAPRETENNAYAKLWGDNQKALWYVMVFSGVANSWNSLHRKRKYISQKFTLSVREKILFSLHLYALN